MQSSEWKTKYTDDLIFLYKIPSLASSTLYPNMLYLEKALATTYKDSKEEQSLGTE